MTPKEIAYQARTYPHRDIEGMINNLINERLCNAESAVAKHYKHQHTKAAVHNSDNGKVRQLILDRCIPIEKD